jgi:hypothetical protein
MESGALLLDSGKSELFVPGIINVCLATEIFLKSIYATTFYITDIHENGMGVGRGNVKIEGAGRGHDLSKLYIKLPEEIKLEIQKLSLHQGYNGDIAIDLERYDKVFIEWRYIYESTDPKVLGSHPLVQISNAIQHFCELNKDKTVGCIATPHTDS